MDRDDVIRSINNIKRNRATVALSLPARKIVGSMCPKCRGVGYMRLDVQPGHPQFGKAVLCSCKESQAKEKRKESLIEVSGIMNLKRYQDASFETFAYSLPNVQSAYDMAWNFAQNPTGWFVMTGDPGCGKTHLAVSIAKRRIEAGDTVLFQTVPDLLDYLRSAFNPSVSESYDERFEQAKNANLLILDDLGAQQDTLWAREKLFQLINHRYNAGLPTVVTSNDIYLQHVDPRVRSRLCDRDFVAWEIMEGARDYRIHGAEEDEV